MPQNTGSKKSEARRIKLKYPAVCKSCQTQLPVGSDVTWYPGGTVFGMACHPSPFATAKPKGKSAKSAPKGKAKSAPPKEHTDLDITDILQNPKVLQKLLILLKSVQ